MKCLVFSGYIQKLQFSSQFQLRINFTKLLTFWRLTPLPELKIPKDFAQILFNAIRKSRVVVALSENEKKLETADYVPKKHKWKFTAKPLTI